MKKDMKYVLVRAYSDNDVVCVNFALFKLSEEQIDTLKHTRVVFEKIPHNVGNMYFGGLTFVYEGGVFCNISECEVENLEIEEELRAYLDAHFEGVDIQNHKIITKQEYDTLLSAGYYEENTNLIQLTSNGIILEGYREGANLSTEFVDIESF